MTIEHYQGNVNLKASNVDIEYTQEQLKEYIKCSRDILYFAENYTKVVHVDHGIVPFKPWDFQENMLSTFKNNRYSICKLSRQCGKTICAAVFLLHEALFKDNQNIAILAHKQVQAIEILARAQLVYEHLPFWLQQGVVAWNKGSIKLENGSRMFASSTSGSAIRGQSCVTGDTKVCIENNGNISDWSINDLINYIYTEGGDVSKKLIENKKGLKIFTQEGFKSFEGILCNGVPNKLLKLTFNDNTNIKCTEDHRFLYNDKFVFAKKLLEGDKLSEKIIIKIEYVEPDNVYDIFGVKDTHSYISNGVVSHNCTHVLLDEFAFVPNNIQEEFFTSVFPVISSGKTTKLIVTSTPNGMNLFYKIWTDSEQNRNDFARVEAHWSSVPGRDEEWKEETIRNTSERQFRQEYETQFLGSTNTLIDVTTLSKMTYVDPLYEKNHFDCYEEVRAGRSYVITVDTSEGLGLDYSAFVVWDITEYPYRGVGKYRNNDISPRLLPDIIYSTAKTYNDAYVLIETDSLGTIVAESLLHDLEYEHLFTTAQKITGPYVSGGFGKPTGRRLGVKTSKLSKRIGCNNLKDLLENDKLLFEDYNFYNEICNFIQTRNSFAAAEGHHDDVVMCGVLFGWLTEQEHFKEITDLGLRAKLLEDNRQRIEEELLPFGFIDDGQDEADVTNIDIEELGWKSPNDSTTIFKFF